MSNPQAFPYIRFSSKQQELGDSVKRQMEVAERWCNVSNITLSSLTFEDLGVSAFKEGGKRPALADMVDCIKREVIPKGSYILLENSDRLSRRGFKVALDIVHDIVQLDVYLVTLSTGQVFNKHNITELSSMLPLLLDADRGRAESERKSILVKSAKRAMRENRVIKGRVPFWITIKDGAASLNDRAPIVRKIIELKQSGYSAQRTAKWLNLNNMLSARGGEWSSVSITSVLANKLLYGCKEYSHAIDGRLTPVEEVMGWCEAICSRRTWLSLQAKRRVKGELSRKGKFTSLLRCPDCGGTMQAKNQNFNGTLYLYRRCSMSSEGRCDNKSSFKDMDIIAEKVLKDLKVIDLTSQKPDDGLEKLVKLENKLSMLEASKDFITNPSAIGKVYNDIAELDEQISELRHNIEVNSLQNKLVNFINLFSLPTPEANIELKRIVKCIKFYKLNTKIDKGIIEFHNKTKITFIVNHTRGGNSTKSFYEIKLVANGYKLPKYCAKKELQQWELEQD